MTDKQRDEARIHGVTVDVIQKVDEINALTGEPSEDTRTIQIAMFHNAMQDIKNLTGMIARCTRESQKNAKPRYLFRVQTGHFMYEYQLSDSPPIKFMNVFGSVYWKCTPDGTYTLEYVPKDGFVITRTTSSTDSPMEFLVRRDAFGIPIWTDDIHKAFVYDTLNYVVGAASSFENYDDYIFQVFELNNWKLGAEIE